MSERVPSCPECRSTDLRRRGIGVSSTADGDGRWRCSACGWRGDVPATRRKWSDGGPRHGLAGRLEALGVDGDV